MTVDTHKTHQQAIHTILLADDDPDDRDMFREALQELDPTIKLEYISDGSKLLSLLQHLRPDLLFLDLEMPRKNGLASLVEIRGLTAYKKLPIVVFSSTNRIHNINTAYEMGADLFVSKPNSYSGLLQLLKKVLALDWSDPEAIREKYFKDGKSVAFE